MNTNKFGLPRDIPENTKRAVRRRCGFGCAVCGCAIVDYHHFNPPFAESEWHDPDGITLLCGLCHERVTRGILDNANVCKANASPWSLKHKYSRDILFVGSGQIPIRIGSVRFCAETIAMFDEEVVFGFCQPECQGGPLRLNAIFTDPSGRDMLRIVNNEWQVGVEQFDVRTKGRILEIQDRPRNIILQMNLNAHSELHIQRLHMQYRGFNIEADDTGFRMLDGRFNHVKGNVVADIGIWMKSTGEVLIAANRAGGAAICLVGKV